MVVATIKYVWLDSLSCGSACGAVRARGDGMMGVDGGILYLKKHGYWEETERNSELRESVDGNSVSSPSYD